MLRAANAGLIDFSQFDPWDAWWWRKLRWVTEELETQQAKETDLLYHHHWVSLAAYGKLPPESFDLAKTRATASINRILKSVYPWLADKIGEAGTQTEREEAVASYHQEYGRPGDPRYEAMVDTVARTLKAMQQGLIN